MFKKLIQYKLKIFAKMILARYKPEIIGITGSVGKTMTKEAVWAVLSPKLNARRSIKNYNNEIGLPLTVIGVESPGKSFFKWLAIAFKAWKLILIKDNNYPKILILEMGVDRPGDMEYLTNIAKCKAGIVTHIGSSHLEFFGSREKIQKEKELLVKKLPESSYAVLNYDDAQVRQIAKTSKAKVLTYGFSEKADIRAQNVANAGQDIADASRKNLVDLIGVTFDLVYGDSAAPVYLSKVVGRGAAEAALAASAVGIIYGLNLSEISKNLRRLNLPKGRMNLIEGIKRTLIIDDTYNSSPQSSIVALEAVKQIVIAYGARKFAVLGDMLELGAYTEEGHREVGRAVVKAGVNKLIAVGERARDIGRGAKVAGMKEDNIFYFPTADDARLFVQDRIKQGDLILVKGSQGARMEKVVEEIMAKPLRAKELLVRQGKEWG